MTFFSKASTIKNLQMDIENYLEYSGINHKFNFMPPVSIDYSLALINDSYLYDAAKGEIPSINALRTKYGADIVVLFVYEEDDDYSGESWAIPALTPQDAFVVINLNGISEKPVEYVVAHEIGHLMGAVHEPGEELNNQPLCSYGRGFCNYSSFKRTIMATACEVSFNLIYGYSTGETSTNYTHNTAKLINLYAPYIASFYEKKKLCLDKDGDSVCDTSERFENFRDAIANCYNAILDEWTCDVAEMANLIGVDELNILVDNCQNKYNEKEQGKYEIVVAPCENGTDDVGGAFCKGAAYKDKNGNWWWQPDHDLDGTGDACDHDTVWSEFNGVPTGNSIVDEIVTENGGLQVAIIRMNETLSVPINLNKSQSTSTSTKITTTRYCWLPEWDKDSWGIDGHCTTEEKHKTNFSEYCDTNFGYSHGSDPVPISTERVLTWKFIKDKTDSTKSNEFTKIKTGETGIINWNWRHDFSEDTDDEYLKRALKTATSCQSSAPLGFCDDGIVPKFYYTMSTGVHSGDMDEDYITNDNEINPTFFKNQKKYTRSSRLTLDPITISYHKEPVLSFFPIGYYCTGGCNFPVEEWHDMLIGRLIYGPRPYEMPGMEHYFKNTYGSDLINTGVSFREWSRNAVGMPSVAEKSRPVYLLTITENASKMNEGIVAVQNSGFIPRSGEAASPNSTFEIKEMDLNSNGDWRTKGILDVSEVPNFMPITSTYHNRELYIVNKNSGNTAHIYRIDKTDLAITPQQFINICPVQWIFTLVDLGTIINLSNITLHSVGNSLFALGKTTSGMKVYKLSEQNGNNYFEDISGTAMPQIRDVYNVEVKDGVLYLAGGALLSESEVHFTNDIWRFTETDGWQLIRNDLNIFPVTLRIDFDGDNIILTDRVIRPNGTTDRAIFADDGTGDIVIETVPVEGANVQGFGDYCLKESETAVQGGIETSGECVPFTHPWYSSFSAGATVYSLDGKEGRLYVGTNNAIKVYDISDPIAPVLVSSFSTSSRVNDLEVYGNTLFAATNGGLYKLDASNDTLTQTLFVSATLNYQYKVEVYDGKLYVGDDNGIKVRDLETMSVLTSVNNGSVLDFAIENGEIGLYKDALFSPVEIRDAETLTLKANEFFGCFEIEVGSSDGRFYLSCDDETYRFEDDGDGGISFTELSGDIRELQDVYTFDGYTYFYDENTIWISTSNDVPAICGNGIVEGDEVCDGGQIDCEELDSNYVSGTATCNSTCDGYNTNNCSDDGW
ncbi:hypothetical protein IKS86_08920 [bacterium]|nr:hypothetical protein [bacterium]